MIKKQQFTLTATLLAVFLSPQMGIVPTRQKKYLLLF